MVEKAKIPIAGLIVLIIISLFLAGGMFYLYNQEHTKKLELLDKLEEIETKQRITEAELEKSKKNISTLQVQLKSAQVQIETLNQQVEQEKAARLEAFNQTEQLKTDLEQQKNLRSGLENKLIQTQQDLKNLESQLKELESGKSALETKIKELEAAKSRPGVELGTIVVAPEKAAAEKKEKKTSVSTQQSKPLEGKVLVVNKEYDFAVINLGSKDGVNVGDIFCAYRKDQYIGDIRVEKVHESMSAAGFVLPDIKDKINEEDKVVQKTK